jgi:hypothetical protein
MLPQLCDFKLKTRFIPSLIVCDQPDESDNPRIQQPRVAAASAFNNVETRESLAGRSTDAALHNSQIKGVVSIFYSSRMAFARTKKARSLIQLFPRSQLETIHFSNTASLDRPLLIREYCPRRIEA